MKIAKQLKEENVCEYLLYMWQLEDTLRAYNCDADRVRNEYVAQFRFEDSRETKAEADWLTELCRMMHEEGITEKGHLFINQGTLLLLTDLHNELLKSPKHPFYSSAYYKALPYMVELRARSNHSDAPELESCFDALYGTMLLRLQKKHISKETAAAVATITKLMAMLAEAWNKERNEELEL